MVGHLFPWVSHQLTQPNMDQKYSGEKKSLESSKKAKVEFDTRRALCRIHTNEVMCTYPLL